jgi:hypothetical protein
VQLLDNATRAAAAVRVHRLKVVWFMCAPPVPRRPCVAAQRAAEAARSVCLRPFTSAPYRVCPGCLSRGATTAGFP